MSVQDPQLFASKFTNAYPVDYDSSVLFQSVTGAIDIVSRDVARSLVRHRNACEPLETQDIPTEVIDQLRQRGHLTFQNPIDEQTTYEHFVTELHKRRQELASGYVMIVTTYACNLRCPYCFQNIVRDRQPSASSFLTPDMVDTYFRRTLPAALRSTFEDLHVTLYGGEPFLANAIPAVERILHYSRVRGFSVSAISNGTTIHHNAHLFGTVPGTVSSVQITLDGPPKDHDVSRIPTTGTPTFFEIIRNIELLANAGVQVQVRVNTTKSVAPNLPELESILAERGLLNRPNISIYTRSVHGIHSPVDGTPSVSGYGEWHLVRDMSKSGVQALRSPLDRAQSDVRRILVAPDRIFERSTNFCMQNRSNALILDHRGDVYGCYEEAGFPKRAIGKVTADGVIEFGERHKKNLSRTLVSYDPCRTCSIGLACGGGCPVAAETECGTIFSSFCDSRKQLIARAVVAEALQGGRRFLGPGEALGREAPRV
jgi:uncharacterized protein